MPNVKQNCIHYLPFWFDQSASEGGGGSAGDLRGQPLTVAPVVGTRLRMVRDGQLRMQPGADLPRTSQVKYGGLSISGGGSRP